MPARLTPLRRRPALACVVLGSLALLLHPLDLQAQFVDATTGDMGDMGPGFGVSWGDFDADGDQDLLVCSGNGTNRLLRNDGGGTFVDATPGSLAGVGGTYSALWGDYDGDGYPDLYMVVGIGPNRLLHNSGDGTFQDLTAGPEGDPGPAQNAAWADYDLDGDLDLYVTFWEAPNKLLRNDGGAFVDVTQPPLDENSRCTEAAWGDFDNDGDPDLYVGSFDGGMLFRNTGGVFEDVTVVPLNKVGVTGLAWGDYDNDGDLDLYLGREVLSNRLLRNETGTDTTSVLFTDLLIPSVRDTLRTQSIVWLDFDNDGDLDLFAANAGELNDSGARNGLMRNEVGSNLGGTGPQAGRRPGPLVPAATEVHTTWATVSSGPILDVENSRGAAAGDADGDGDLDLFVTNWYGEDQFLRNDQTTGNHWLQVTLRGDAGNPQGIGARIRLVAGGLSQMREISGGSGLYSQDAQDAAFGLGTVSTVDTLEVRWPSGQTCTYTHVVGVDRRFTVHENCTGDVTGVGETEPAFRSGLIGYPNPAHHTAALRYVLERAAPVKLEAFDLSGRRVRVLEDRQQLAGAHETVWDGRDEAGSKVPAGVYFLRLQVAGSRNTQRLVWIRP